MEKVNAGREGKMIHVRLPDKIHQQLKINAARERTTIQQMVAALIERNLAKKKG